MQIQQRKIWKKAEWKPEYAKKLIPPFTKEMNVHIPIEEWALRVQRNLDHFSGPNILNVMSISEAVDFVELNNPEFNLGDFTVHNFLLYIVKLWNQKHSEKHLAIQVAKNPKESWNEYLTRLITWVKTAHVMVDDEWYLAHFRAHITYGEDPYPNKTVSPKAWANRMDEVETRYAHAEVMDSRMTDVVAKDESSVGNEKGICFVRERRRPPVQKKAGRTKHYRFTKDGRPICKTCNKVRHIARDCPLNRKQFSGVKGHNFSHYSKSIVYAIEEKASTPLVIHVSVNNNEINAMLDSEAMENVIDIYVLREIAPRSKLQYFGKRLIGADKKPIVVRGAAWLPVKIGNHRTSLHCVAVENLNTKLIIGLPGLRHLGLSADFGTRTVKMGSVIINTIG